MRQMIFNGLLCMSLILAISQGLCAQASENKDTPDKPNLIKNGGFEQGVKYWSHQEWKGYPLPGRIDTEGAFEGKQCFVFTEPGTTDARYIRTAMFDITPGQDYTLSMALATQDLPKEVISISVLQYAAKEGKKWPVLGWLMPGRPGVYNLIPSLAGTTDWKVYTIKIPGKTINPKTVKVAVYFNFKQPSVGELKIDALQWTQD